MKRLLSWTAISVAVLLTMAFALSFKGDLSKEDLAEYWQPPSRFLDLPSGATVHYRIEGNADAPTVVLVHGGYSSLHAWEPWMAALKRQFRVVRFDLPAHGLTGRVPGDDYSRSGLVRVAHEFFQELELNKFSMIGWSMGGAIVIQYTLNHPENVDAIVLMGSEGIPEKDGYDPQNVFVDEETKQAMREGTFVPDLEHSLFERMMQKMSNSFLTREIHESIVYDPSSVSEKRIQRSLDLGRFSEVRFAAPLMTQQTLAEAFRNGPRDLEPRLKEIHKPALVLNGDSDILVPPETAAKFVAELPNSKLIIYERVGHLPPLENRDHSVADVIEFLSEVYE